MGILCPRDNELTSAIYYRSRAWQTPHGRISTSDALSSSGTPRGQKRRQGHVERLVGRDKSIIDFVIQAASFDLFEKAVKFRLIRRTDGARLRRQLVHTFQAAKQSGTIER